MAIQTHVERTHRAATDDWFHPRPTKAFTGAGPVEAVGVHHLDDHWLLVTYGLTELHAKDSLDREVSGWGFELTFRVVAEEIPLWAVDFLASLASYVWSSRHPFAPGHLMDLRGPVHMDSRSAITAGVIAEDPALGAMDGPYGSVQFLEVVGLTADELELCRAWNPAGVLGLLTRTRPLLVTDLDRPSVAADERYAAEIEARMAEEGSEMHELRVASLRIKRRLRGKVDVQMGAGAAAALGPALRRELLADGSSFSVVGDDGQMRFVVGTDPGWAWTEDGIEGTVSLDGVEYVAGLFDGRTGWGRVSDWEGLRFRVVA